MQPEIGNRRFFLYAIWIAISIGIALRFYALDRQSLWPDELFSVGLATIVGENPQPVVFKHLHTLTIEDSFWSWKFADQTPPLYDLVLRGWSGLAGDSDTALRLPSAIFGTALLLFSFFYLRKILPLETLFYYISLLSLSFMLIQYSQEARGYALSSLLSGMLAAVWAKDFFEFWSRRQNLRINPGALVLMTLLPYNHYYGIIITGVFCTAYGVFFIRQKNYRGIALLCIPGLLFLPYLYLSLNGILYMHKYQAVPVGFHEHIEQIIKTILKYYFPAMGYFALGLIMFIAGWNFYAMNAKPAAQVALQKIAALGFGISLVFIASVFAVLHDIGFTEGRHFIFALPPFLLAVAVWLGEFSAQRIYKVTLFITMIAYSLYISLSSYYIPYKEQYREAAQFIAQAKNPQDVVITTWKPSRFFYLHYLRRFAGDTIDSTVLSVNTANEAASQCNPSNTQSGKKVFLYYHVSHAPTALGFIQACQNKSTRIENKEYIGIRVNIFYF
jgi:uncharacterized membrane protein